MICCFLQKTHTAKLNLKSHQFFKKIAKRTFNNTKLVQIPMVCWVKYGNYGGGICLFWYWLRVHWWLVVVFAILKTLVAFFNSIVRSAFLQKIRRKTMQGGWLVCWDFFSNSERNKQVVSWDGFNPCCSFAQNLLEGSRPSEFGKPLAYNQFTREVNQVFEKELL